MQTLYVITTGGTIEKKSSPVRGSVSSRPGVKASDSYITTFVFCNISG